VHQRVQQGGKKERTLRGKNTPETFPHGGKEGERLASPHFEWWEPRLQKKSRERKKNAHQPRGRIGGGSGRGGSKFNLVMSNVEVRGEGGNASGSGQPF